MSNTSAPIVAATVPFTPVSVLKMDVKGALSRRIADVVAKTEGGNISGRHVKVSAQDLKALTSSYFDANTIATALCSAVVNYFNGSGPLKDSADRFPAWLAYATTQTLTSLAPAGGCDEDRLRHATFAIVAAFPSAKPVEPKKPKASAAGPVTIGSVAPAPVAVRPLDVFDCDQISMAAGSDGLLALGALRLKAMDEAAAIRADIIRTTVEPAPAPKAIVPALSNDFRTDAHAFVLSMGEEKARLFLAALQAELNPVSAPAMPLSAPKRARKGAAPVVEEIAAPVVEEKRTGTNG